MELATLIVNQVIIHKIFKMARKDDVRKRDTGLISFFEDLAVSSRTAYELSSSLTMPQDPDR